MDLEIVLRYRVRVFMQERTSFIEALTFFSSHT